MSNLGNPEKDPLVESIFKALEEEKRSYLSQATKFIFSLIIISLVTILPFYLFLREHIENVHLLVAIALWFVVIVGFLAFYQKPQPRLAVPGYWSAWVYSKMSLSFVISGIFTILVCPSFVFIHSDFLWNPMQGLTQFLMEAGGMSLCMLFCGFVFTGFSTLVSMASIKRILKGFGSRESIRITCYLSLLQIPILYLLIATSGVLSFGIYWLIGSVFGILLTANLAIFLIKKLPSLSRS